MAATRPSFMPKIKTATPATPAEAAPEVVETPAAAAAPAPVVEQVTVAPEAVPAAAAPKEKKEKKERKKPNRPMTPEDTEFIVANVKTMSYTDIANARGITKHQVNRVLMETKKQLKEACGDDAESLAAVNAYISEHLSRPEDTRPGGGAGRASVVKASINDIVGNILNGLS